MDVNDPNEREQQGPQAPAPGPSQPPAPGPESAPPQQPPPGYAPPAGAAQPPWTATPAYHNPPNAPGAVASLVLGILGIVICGLCAPFAWWQGQRARQAVDRSGGSLGGRGMATAGFVMGIIGTALLALGVVLLIVFVAAGVSLA
jgi:Domain of unknown function (DUF4190)